MIEHKRTGLIDAVTWRVSRVVMYMTALIVIIMTYEVFMRYVLEKPTIWVNEMTLWIGGWVYLLAGLYAMQQRSHIRIYLLYAILPRWMQRLFDAIATLFIVLWVAATVYGGFNEAYTAFIRWETFDSAWAPPIPAITQPLILIIMMIIAVQAISNLIFDWNTNPEDQAGGGTMEEEIEEIKKSHQESLKN